MVQALRHSPWKQYVRSMEMLSCGPQFVDSSPEQFEVEVDIKVNSKVRRSAIMDELRCLRAGGIDSTTYDIRCPTLVIAGQYDAPIPNCYARCMAEEIPGSEFVVIAVRGTTRYANAPRSIAPDHFIA